MWDYCGMERSDEGLRKALDRIPELRREFWSGVKVPGSAATLNQSLEKAGRVADFLELAELMCLDALHRSESCGGHFRAESQTADGEAQRDDENFSYVAAWEYTGPGQAPVLHKEDLVFEYVTPEPAELHMNLKLKVWRQGGPDDKGRLVDYVVDDADEDMSFLELIDVLNEKLILQGEEPVAFDQDCREGICGSCDMVVNGYAHGPQKATTVCQLHLRHFRDGETITVEPWRSAAFPVLKDLVVDRSALDRIVAAGGYISAPTGSAPDAAATPVPKPDADRAFTAAACIGCGACVAACPNGSASLFLGAKIAHLAELPQGQPERWQRVVDMVDQHDAEGFGGCTNTGQCTVACPKEIPLDVIATLNRDYRLATTGEKAPPGRLASPSVRRRRGHDVDLHVECLTRL